MKYLFGVIVLIGSSSLISADIFGTGGNQFEIEFLTISGGTNPTSGIPAGNYFMFIGVDKGYCIGKLEITNAQWTKFTNISGIPIGNPSNAYESSAIWTGANVPATNVSWYEAAQFVNWLNTSTGHHPAYNFTGTQGTESYTFALWDISEAWNETNLYRHKDAYYFLPTEDEWVKAAYWNGVSIQTCATKAGETLFQGDGSSGTGWCYHDFSLNSNTTNLDSPWDVGSGSKELNGTHDMMGNAAEWTESPTTRGNYVISTYRSLRGGAWSYSAASLASTDRRASYPYHADYNIGFRVASRYICTAPIPGDLDNDCRVDMADLAILVSNWLQCNIEPQTACWE